MSEEEFYGWIPPSEYGAIRFEMCDVCRRKTPSWVETKTSNGITEIRLVCDDCHNVFESSRMTKEVSEDESSDQVEMPDTDDSRPEWMDDFIKQQKASGSIETIGGERELEESTKRYKDTAEDEEGLTFEGEIINTDILKEEIDNNAIATWSSDFIKESLFGENPESWLESLGAYQIQNIQQTLNTLKNLISNKVSSVKLSAILCLAGIAKREVEFVDEVKKAIKLFESDTDEIVANYATENIDKL